MGRVSLIDWKDTSKGILAYPHKVRGCSPAEIDGIEYFIERIG
jgi:hypothetical protein